MENLPKYMKDTIEMASKLMPNNDKELENISTIENAMDKLLLEMIENKQNKEYDMDTSMKLYTISENRLCSIKQERENDMNRILKIMETTFKAMSYEAEGQV